MDVIGFAIYNNKNDALGVIDTINLAYLNEQKNWLNYADLIEHPTLDLFAVPIIDGFESYFEEITTLTEDWVVGNE